MPWLADDRVSKKTRRKMMASPKESVPEAEALAAKKKDEDTAAFKYWR